MAYQDRGNSEAIFQAEQRVAPANDGYGRTFTGNNGTYEDPRYFLSSGGAGVSGNPSHEHDHGLTVYDETGMQVGTQTGIPTKITYYKMQGYYVTGSVYEDWLATGTPNNTPPSGHSLTNVVIIDSITI